MSVPLCFNQFILVVIWVHLLQIYDPYYCDGAAKRHLASLGFLDVHNEQEDFYSMVLSGKTPTFDAIVTNPPFGDTHTEYCLRYAVWSGKPSFVLMPNYVYTRPFFQEACGKCKPMWLVSPKRFAYKSPKHLREGRNAKQRAYTSPTHTFWYCILLGARRGAIELYRRHVGSHVSVLCENMATIPEYAQSRDKDTPLAKFRGSFHALCKEKALGKLCIEWTLCGVCSCNSVRRGAFLHPTNTRPIQQQLRAFLDAHPVPDAAGWAVRPELGP